MFHTIAASAAVAALAACLFGATPSPTRSLHAPAAYTHGTCCRMSKSGECCGMCPSCCVKRSCTQVCCDTSKCTPAATCCR